jgi:6-phosphofructokinase 1
MTAVLEGRYARVALPDPALPPRTVDVATMYNEERFRPQYSGRLGLPLLLRSDA